MPSTNENEAPLLDLQSTALAPKQLAQIPTVPAPTNPFAVLDLLVVIIQYALRDPSAFVHLSILVVKA